MYLGPRSDGSDFQVETVKDRDGSRTLIGETRRSQKSLTDFTNLLYYMHFTNLDTLNNNKPIKKLK